MTRSRPCCCYHVTEQARLHLYTAHTRSKLASRLLAASCTCTLVLGLHKLCSLSVRSLLGAQGVSGLSQKSVRQRAAATCLGPLPSVPLMRPCCCPPASGQTLAPATMRLMLTASTSGQVPRAEQCSHMP